MDKNLLLAVSLSILVYAAWFGFIEKRFVKVPTKPAVAATATTTPVKPIEMPKAAAVAAKPAAQEKDSTEAVTFEKAELVIRAKGAAVVSWKYHGPRGSVELVPNGEPGFLATFPDLTFKRASGLTYVATRADGLRVTKQFVEGGEGQLPRVKITIENPTAKTAQTGEWTISVGPGLGTIATEEKENAKLTRTLGLTKAEGGLQGKVEVMKQPAETTQEFRWAGVDNRYFLAAMLPAPGDFAKAAALENHALSLTAKSADVAPKSSKTWEIPFYVGAKGHTWLSRYKLGLERSIDFGFFAQLGRFVLKVLGRIHDVTGNWGWSIIILTMILQLIMFPLTFKSLKAAAAMKNLQPEIARLQQRYSKDPQKLNVEMMELYKKHGANPLGGCLPMLVQMPVFIALFNALRNAWELHGASWIFWIHDLSAKDPYYVLPLVMGGLMFAQNKLNPAAGADPTQQQMMTFMPIIFTVMFMNFPSGLVLYWLTNSLVSTVQQLVLKDRLAAKPVRA